MTAESSVPANEQLDTVSMLDTLDPQVVERYLPEFDEPARLKMRLRFLGHVQCDCEVAGKPFPYADPPQLWSPQQVSEVYQEFRQLLVTYKEFARDKAKPDRVLKSIDYAYLGLYPREIQAVDNERPSRFFNAASNQAVGLLVKAYGLRKDLADGVVKKKVTYVTSAGVWDFSEPLLDAEQEQELAKKIEAGVLAAGVLSGTIARPDVQPPASDNELVQIIEEGQASFAHMTKANLRLLRYFAMKYRAGLKSAGIERYEDLMPTMVVDGLHQAIMRYDRLHPSGARFGTYATHWVKRVILHTIATNQPVTMNQTSYWNMRKLAKIVTELETDGKEIDLQGIAKSMRISGERAQDLLEADRVIKSMIHMNKRIDGVDGTRSEIGEMIADASVAPVEDQVAARVDGPDISDRMKQALATLTTLERTVVECVYGLQGVPIDPIELSNYLSVDEAAIDEALRLGLGKLHDALNEDSDEDAGEETSS
jgi:RNA polymerase sigma factor (sigma-70 family)